MKPGSVRIIAGKWRGRRLNVLDVKDLRPTPDRVRETLFNWLTPVIHGAHCLDLFAGTGVLGLEALSRGAASVTMVDQSPEVVTHLTATLQLLKATNADAYRAAVPNQLKAPAHPFDIVFIDPPYQSNLQLPCCHYLEEHDFLADITYIYLEAGSVIKDNDLPATWRLIKSQQAGAVAYHLARREKV